MAPPRSLETAPLLAPEPPPCATARLPFHPAARATPLWRRLTLRFVDGRAAGALRSKDLWPLEAPFHGARAAADLRAHAPPRGRALRLFRALVAVNKRRLVRVMVLSAVSVTLTALRRLLLYALLLSGDAPWGPLVAMAMARMAFTFVTCHGYVVMDRVQLQFYSGLFATVIDRISTSAWRPMETLAGAADARAPRSHKQRLEEITKMLANDISTVGELFEVVFDAWAVALKLAVSIAVLGSVVDISWHAVAIALGVYTAALVADVALGGRLAARAESTLMARLSVVHDCLKSIQMIKLNAWEDKVEAGIRSARSEEQAAGARMRAWSMVVQELTSESPMLLGAVLFGAMASNEPTSPSLDERASGYKRLTPARAFAALLLLSDCLRYVSYFKYAVKQTVVGFPAWRRVEAFVLSDAHEPEQRVSSPEHPSEPNVGNSVVMELNGASVSAASSPSTARALLLGVDWSLHRGDLVVVHGAAGVGKSMLLAAVRGDAGMARLIHGDARGVAPDCRIAYCSQDPWLQTLSIRDNILFGTDFDESKYWAVVDACGLLEDLAALPFGDGTVVGPRGINLSSGQSARIALARACYADADLYLLDCPLANVDALVQSEIFRKCIVELLMFKTVVIVTHNPEYIGSTYVDQRVEVMPLSVHVSDQHSHSRTAKTNRGGFRSRRVRDRATDFTARFLHNRTIVVSPLSAESCQYVEQIKSKSDLPETPAPSDDDCLSSGGSVEAVSEILVGTSASMYFAWMVALVLCGLFVVARDVWLMEWSASVVVVSQDPLESPARAFHAAPGAAVYACLVFACITACLVVRWAVYVCASSSATGLFLAMTRAVLRAPMTLFYLTPIGEALGRFYNDMSALDRLLPQHLGALLLCVASFLGRTLLLGWLLGPMAVVIIVAGYAAVTWTLSLSFRVEIILMRLRANARLLSLVSEIVDGEAVIRAFGENHAKHVFRSVNAVNDTFKRVTYLATVFNSATILHCDAVGTAVVLSLLGVVAAHSLTPAKLWLALLYIFTMQQEVVSQFGTGLANTSVALHSAARIREYGRIRAESDDHLVVGCKDLVSDGTWPQRGQLTFEHVGFAYTQPSSAELSTLALRDVSFTLRGGEKIGVVGRTGSGKSSLAMALLRVHPLRSGRISLDGVDLRTVPLTQLRRSITMIPQSPTFYRCSVRDYLDPFREFDDARLWRELLTVELGTRVQSLDEELLDNGENWSLGQRQLLCFARALLKPSRVVVLDEAFSCVDQSCQEKILRVLGDRFASSTVVLITHRLDQILAFDRILVMRGGRVVESGSASELASDASSVFYEFLETSLLTL